MSTMSLFSILYAVAVPSLFAFTRYPSPPLFLYNTIALQQQGNYAGT
jgi:hypothetical protein